MTEGKAIIDERSKIRGTYSDQARVSQNLKHVFRAAPGKFENLTPSMKESLDNMANKFARILTGDPCELDSWMDLSGYAELIIRELHK